MALASTSATASAAVLKNPFLGARRSLANAASLGAAKPAACRVVVVAAAVGKKSWIPAVKSDAEFINPSWLDGSLPASCAEPTSQDTRDPSPIVPAPAATDLSQEGSPGMAVPGGEGERRQRPVVLVTGCSEGGIGHSMARAFAAAGCAVVATARSRASMRGLEGDPRYLLLELDVRSDESARRAVGDALRELGRVDVLVNNAGIHLVAPLAEVPMESFHQVFDTNVYGAMRMIQAVIPHMMERREGTIVNVGSITALAPGPWAGVYSASKAALHALGDTLRVELKSFGINVMTVAPGGTKTNMGSKSADKYDQINDWKYYKKYDKSLRARTNITQGAGSVSAEDLAKRVVNLVLKKNPPAWFAYGQFTAILTILYYAPLWLRDYFYKLVMKC